MLQLRLVLSLALIAAALLVPALASAACVPTCDVKTVDATARWAFVPPATFVESGSSVAWSALDKVVHTATDRASLCFSVAFAGPSVRSVRFFVDGGTLYAASGTEAPEPCTAAVALPGGAFALRYECLVHPGAMEGQVVVR